jgi:hypothetical protein
MTREVDFLSKKIKQPPKEEKAQCQFPIQIVPIESRVMRGELGIVRRFFHPVRFPLDAAARNSVNA